MTFPPEYEEELLDLVQTWGGFVSLEPLASYFDTTVPALKAFMATKKYREALARYRPETRLAAQRSANLQARDPALPED